MLRKYFLGRNWVARTFIAAGRMAEAEQHLQAILEIMVDAGQAPLDYANVLDDEALWHWHNNEHQEDFEATQAGFQNARNEYAATQCAAALAQLQS